MEEEILDKLLSDPVVIDDSPALYANNDDKPCGRKFITVNYGSTAIKIDIDGTTEAIEEIIKITFGIRSRRAFWLKDEEEVLCPIHRCMQPGNYTLYIDKGISIKVQNLDMTRKPFSITFYVKEDFENFLVGEGWTYLQECEGLRRTALDIDELLPGVVYRGCKL